MTAPAVEWLRLLWRRFRQEKMWTRERSYGIGHQESVAQSRWLTITWDEGRWPRKDPLPQSNRSMTRGQQPGTNSPCREARA
jgi:hypothetical protein